MCEQFCDLSIVLYIIYRDSHVCLHINRSMGKDEIVTEIH